MQQGDLGLSDRGQDIDRVLAVGERLFLGESVLFEQILPGLLIANTTTLPERPALEITDWHICVDASLPSQGFVPPIGRQTVRHG